MNAFDRKILATAAVIVSTILALAACSPEQQTRAVTVAQAVCRVDAVAQPLVVALGAPVVATVAPGTAPAVAGVVAFDQATVHPAVVAACARIGGTAVGAVAAAPDEVAETPAGR